jgi:glutamyl-tRNA reductase
MARLSLQALRSAGVGRLTVVSRTPPDAAALEGASARPLDDLEDALAGADVVLSSTASPGVVLERELVERVRRPLVIVDIAVPRDVDPTVGELEDVVLRDIDDLRSVVEANVGSRVAEISKVDEFVSEEVERFTLWERAGEYAPTIAALVRGADDLRRAELERSSRSLAGLTLQQRDAVDHLTRRLVSKLLHKPVKNARRLAGSERGDLLLEAVHELFELDDGDAR